MKVDALIGLSFFFIVVLVLNAYTYSGRTPMPRLTFPGKMLFVLSGGGIFLGMIGVVIGWGKPEGGVLLMGLSAAGLVISFVINVKLQE